MEANEVSVLGAGAWGTAMAVLLAGAGRRVVLHPRRPEQAEQLQAERVNADYLPGVRFPEALRVETRLEKALEGRPVVLLACPTQGLREWSGRLSGVEEPPPVLLSLAKGLEEGTHLRPSQILASCVPGVARGTLSGPSNAAEVAAGRPTAVVLACEGVEADALAGLRALLSTPSLRVYSSADLAGVELGGCLKNIYAIAAGCCDGLGLGDNTKAALLTRALAEMVRLGQLLGARAETFYGLGGFGDLVATANGKWSRNRSFGEAIARGGEVSRLMEERRTVVEGYRSTRSFHQLCLEKGLDAPILAQVHAVLYEKKSPALALGALMARDLKSE